jgi:hypothetical protein
MTTTWDDVPDPRGDERTCSGRCRVVAEDRAWRHIVEEHVAAGREPPWDEWLSPDLARRFRAAWQLGTTDEQRTQTIRDVSVIVEKEAKACLGIPLALLFDNYQSPPPGGHSRPQETWNLVLPAGALLVVRSRPEGGAVTTCYFKRAACHATDPGQRWRTLVRDLLQTYARRQPDGTFVPGDRGGLIRRGDVETRGGVRFRTPTTWCLDGRQPEPWRTMPNPWPGPRPPEPPRRLGPRRRY